MIWSHVHLPVNEHLGFIEVVRTGLEHKIFVSLIKHLVDHRIRIFVTMTHILKMRRSESVMTLSFRSVSIVTV